MFKVELFKFIRKILNFKLYVAFLVYILIGVITPLFESFVYISILAFFTNTSLENYFSFLSFFDLNFLSISFIILIALVCKSLIIIFDSFLPALLRKKIQLIGLNHLFMSKSSSLTNLRHGDLLNILTVESTLSAKVIYSVFNLFFNAISVLLISFLLIKVSFEYTLILFLILIPILVLSKFLLKIQTRISKVSSNLRGVYSSDISDSLYGLSKILVTNNIVHHINRTNKNQNLLTSTEIYSNLPSLFFGNINLLILFILFFGLYIFSNDINFDLIIFASIAVLGLRLVNYFSSLMNSIGTIYRLSGSISAIFPIINLPPRQIKTFVSDVFSISTHNLSFSFHRSHLIFPDVELIKGRINLILGKSGSGKSTLLNLISGLYDAESGVIIFHSSSGHKFLNNNYTAEICMVQQDVHLFNCTIREYLCSGLIISDEKIFETLKYVDAIEFVDKVGGIDAVISDGGKNFSGGQKRRLEIASAILSGANVLLFDESCSGLDKNNREAFISYLKILSKDYIVVMVEHNIVLEDVNLVYID